MTSLEILTNQICLFPSYKWVICRLLDWITYIKDSEVAQDLNYKTSWDAHAAAAAATVTLQISQAAAFIRLRPL